MSDSARIIKIARDTIKIEAKSLSSLEKSIGEDFYQIVKKIFDSKGRVVICGLGKSGLIGMKIAATLNSTGTAAVFVHAGDATHGDIGTVKKEDIFIAISKSGNTQEISDLIPFIKNNGNTLIGMTANRTSTLAKKSDLILFTPVEKEACPHNLAPTTSTTSQLAAGDALAMALMELNDFKPVDFANLHPSGSLGKKLTLKVRDLLKDDLKPQVAPEDSMKDVIFEISEKRLGATVVIDNNKIKGMITDGDIRRVLEKQNDIRGLIASELMNERPISVHEDSMAVDALSVMQNKKINHLIVTGIENSYMGIVHIQDFIKEGLSK